MSNTTILELTTASTVTETTDYIPVVDTSDTTETSDGTTKKATVRKILGDKALPSGDIVGTSDTQTLTGKTLTSPKLNEDVALTASATELNQLDDNTFGGTTTGDVVTIDDTQTLTNKSMTSPVLTTPLADVISEATAAAGVTIDSVLLKDGNVSIPGTSSFKGTTTTLDDNEATSFTPSNTLGVMLIYGRATGYKAEFGIISWRVEATEFAQIIVGSAALETAVVPLTGTTGTDGKFTVSADQTTRKIYIENRMGASRSYGYILFGT